MKIVFSEVEEGFREKWVEALRSGKYRQGRSKLRSDNDEFCCLGVACDLVEPDAWSPLPQNNRFFVWRGYTYSTAPFILDEPSEDEQPLICLNDSLGYTFDQIADVIEAAEVRYVEGEYV